MNLGPTELIVILIIVMLLFGAARLPKLARSLGESSREFKKGLSEAERAAEEASDSSGSESSTDSSNRGSSSTGSTSST